MKGCFTIKKSIKYLIYFGTLIVLFAFSFFLPQYTNYGLYVTQLLLFILLASLVTIGFYELFNYIYLKKQNELINIEVNVLKFLTLSVIFSGLALASYLQLRFIDLNLTPPLNDIIYFDDYGYYIHQTPYVHLAPTDVVVKDKTNTHLIMEFKYENPNTDETPWYTLVRVELFYDNEGYLDMYSSETATNYNLTSYQSFKIVNSYTYMDSYVAESSTQFMVHELNRDLEAYDTVSLYQFTEDLITGSEIVYTDFVQNEYNIDFTISMQHLSPYLSDKVEMYQGTMDYDMISIADYNTFSFIGNNDQLVTISSLMLPYQNYDNVWVVTSNKENGAKIHNDYTYIDGVYGNYFIRSTSYGTMIETYDFHDGVSNDDLSVEESNIHGLFINSFFDDDPYQEYINSAIPDFRTRPINASFSGLISLYHYPTITLNPALRYLRS